MFGLVCLANTCVFLFFYIYIKGWTTCYPPFKKTLTTRYLLPPEFDNRRSSKNYGSGISYDQSFIFHSIFSQNI